MKAHLRAVEGLRMWQGIVIQDTKNAPMRPGMARRINYELQTESQV